MEIALLYVAGAVLLGLAGVGVGVGVPAPIMYSLAMR